MVTTSNLSCLDFESAHNGTTEKEDKWAVYGSGFVQKAAVCHGPLKWGVCLE